METIKYVYDSVTSLPRRMARFLWRNRLRLAVSGLLAIVVYKLLPLILRRLHGWQENELRRIQDEFAVRTRLENYFTEAQRTCQGYLIALLPSLHAQLQAHARIPSPAELRTPEKDRKYKLWEQCKTQSFARLVSTVYAVCTLSLLIRAQVNIVSRYLHLLALTKPEEADLDGGEPPFSTETQEAFFRLGRQLVERSLPELCIPVHNAAVDSLRSVSLGQLITCGDVERVVSDMRSRIDTEDVLAQCFADERIGDNGDSVSRNVDGETLTLLVNEARDYLETDECVELLEATVERCIHVVFRNLEDTAFGGGKATTVPLARLLPHLKRLSNELVHATEGENDFINTLGKSEAIQTWSYDIFTKGPSTA